MSLPGRGVAGGAAQGAQQGGLGEVLGEALGSGTSGQQQEGGMAQVLESALGGESVSSGYGAPKKKNHTLDIILLICTLGLWYFRMKKRGR